MAVTLGKRATLKSGPWSGVFNTTDPWDSPPHKLVDARNVYFPDPENRSGTYARPGFTLTNAGAVVSSGDRGQGSWTHFDTDSTSYNFQCFAGKLFRQDAATGLLTDVTPVGVTISSSAFRVYGASLGGVMCVNDGVNRPWVASNLSATPITGTYIDFDGAGTAWVAFGPPVPFGGSGFFVLRSVNSVGASIDIAWSEPNDWTTGYQQTDFDNRWTLEQTGTAPIYALAATNIALYYFRQRSIGAISGTVGPDLASTATHDAISSNVGTQAPQTIVQFSDTIFFCDSIGRPWQFRLGSAPQPIWHQLRAIIDQSAISYPTITSEVATASFEPTLNLYCVAIWTSSAANSASPVEWHAFDANTGTYAGRWSIGPTSTGVFVDSMGTWMDSQGSPVLVVQGSLIAGGTKGYTWLLNSLVGVPDSLALEDLTTFLTTEDGTTLLTIEGQPAVWTDNGDVPCITIQTDRLGYADDIVWVYDAATVLTGSQAPINVSVQTAAVTNTLEASPTPLDSADGIYRSVLGLDTYGRGAMVSVQPTTAENQWFIEQISLGAVPSRAGYDDN